ncbi:MAG: putative reverse transcriptase, partial [Streblomastix strix]
SKRYAYYDSDADEKVSIKVGKLLEGVFQKSAQDFDPLGFKLDQLDRKALFEKVKLKKVEKHWKLLDVMESAKGEKSVQFHRAVESSATIQEGLYKSIRHIASVNTGNQFGELLEIFQASAVATGDAQSIREGQNDGKKKRTSQERDIVCNIKEDICKHQQRVERGFSRVPLQQSELWPGADNQVQTPIGTRLLQFAEEWNKIGRGNLIRTGIQAHWSYLSSPQNLESNKFISQQRCSRIQDQALSSLIETELLEEIIEEVNGRDFRWINPIFGKYKKEQKKSRKITDCSIQNKCLISDQFQIEDVHTLSEMNRPGDWTIKIDLESTFHHVLVNKNLKSFLGFIFHGRFYRYRAMCFGIRQASLIFYKTLRPLMQLIRDNLRIRCVAYCDDLIFINSNQTELQIQVPLLIQTLNSYGFKISINKSILIHTQSVKFLGWQFEMAQNRIAMTEWRENEMLVQIFLWIATIISQKSVKVRWLARITGTMNFLRLQIQRCGLHMRNLNKYKTNVILRSDASQTKWRATITFLETGLKEMHEQSWNRDSKLTSSNQREAAAIFQGLRRFAMSPIHNQIKALRIETDNLSAAFNINRGAAGQALQQTVDQTLQLIQQLDLHVTARHIAGLFNQEADQLSRLAAAGDYQIREEVLEEALFLKKDPWAVRQDGMALPWENELPLLHPLIALIQPTLNKIMKEVIRAVLITSYQKAQTCWPDLEKLAIQYIILGYCKDVLILGQRMKKKKRHLLPWKLQITLLEGKRGTSYTNGSQDIDVQKNMQSQTQQMDGTKLDPNLDNESENSLTTGKQLENNQLKSDQQPILQQKL